MTHEEIRQVVKWTKKNINIYNTEVPEEVLNMLGRSTPESVSDEFLKLAIVAYAVKEGLTNKDRANLSD